MNTILLLLLLVLNPSPETQDKCACCTPEHQQFDFWIGDWDVYNDQGVKIGENLVKPLEDHCIISENWQGVKGGSGKSFNYYNPDDQTWNQLWLSNSGNILKLKGTASKGEMVLKSDLQEGRNGKFYNKITWTKNPDNSVTQLWEIMDENGNSVAQSFKGIYRRKN